MFYRLLCKGNKHQGDIDEGGRQCCCIALVFLSSPDNPKSPKDVDDILEMGTSVYRSVCTHDGFMFVTELSGTLLIGNTHFEVSMQAPRSGMVTQEDDNKDSQTFSLESAIQFCFEDSPKCFLTVGNQPGSTIGIKYSDSGKYIVMDSHSRDNEGKCSPDHGKAVVIEIPNIPSLVKHIKDMSLSLSSSDIQFEITPVSFNLR